MPGSSNFKIFDESSSNIMADADYTASPQRQNGVGNGIADPALHNKLFRQTSMMVSALADSLASKGYTVTDTDYAGLVTILNNIALTADYPKTLDDLTDVIIATPANKQLLMYNIFDSKWENETPIFSMLTDVPQTYVGQSGKGIRVKATEDGLEFYTGSVADNSVSDDAIGDRTVTDATLLASYTGDYTTLLTGIISLQKLITGKENARTAPITSLEALWTQKWNNPLILFNPADLYVSPGIPLSRNGTMTAMDFHVTGTPASATVITLKRNGTALSPTVSLSAAGKTTLTFTTAVTGTADDLFSYSVAGAGLVPCTVVCNQKWSNR